MPSQRQELEALIEGLEAQRALIGDGATDAALTPLRAKLVALSVDPEAANPSDQALRQVTVLFLDAVGSTALGGHLDPEDMHVVMDGLLTRCTAIVKSHGGKVLQYAGDSLLAVFGAEKAQEDDAARAVHAGLGMLVEGHRCGEDVKSRYGHSGLDVRIGAHTGAVLLGGGVDAEGNVRGLNVHIAARMEQTAPSGAFRISHETFAQVRGLFEVEVQEPLSVKGVPAPIQSYLVKSAKPRTFCNATRGVEGVLTRMIGREAELEALQEVFRRLFSERQLAVVTIVAEAGIGKSRLLREFESWSEGQTGSFHVFRGQATPQTQRQPLGLLRDILAWRFRIADDDTLETARNKIEREAIAFFRHDDDLDVAEAHVHLLGHLVGIDYQDSRHISGILDDSQQIRSRTFYAAAQLFRRVSASDGSPVVLQLEDLHWADDASLDFLDYLAEVNRDVPTLVLGFARPTLFERRPDWGSADCVRRRIDLRALDEFASAELARELLKRLAEVPAALRALITNGAEGNPFYMEELVNMLVDHGAIDTSSDRWALHTEKLLATQVPSTLTGVLQARLDGLPVAERQTLQEASVIGPIFWDEALSALNERAKEVLPALVQRELVLARKDVPFDGAGEYAFKHHILHQVAYNTVLKRTRRELHGKLARWLSKQTGVRANDFVSIIADHYEKAGDGAEAVEYHARAAELAETRFAHDVVLDHVQRALDLLDAVDTPSPGRDASIMRWRLVGLHEEALNLQGRRTEQRTDIEAMERLSDTLDDDRYRALAAVRRSRLSQRVADFPAMDVAARRAMALAERAAADDVRLSSMRLVASALAMQGEFDAGKSLAKTGLTEVRRRDLGKLESLFLDVLALIAALQDDPVLELELNSQILNIYQKIQDRRGEAVAVGNRGIALMNLGELVSAKRELEESLRLHRSNGNRALECHPLCNLSKLAVWQGDNELALDLARSAAGIAVAVEARNIETLALLQQGNAELALGRHAAAAQAYQQSHTVAVHIDDPVQHDATAGLARVALAQNDARAAMQHVEGLIAFLESSGKLSGADAPRRIALTCQQVLAGVLDPRAAEWLECMHRNLQASAEAITDASVRQCFLTQIPEHREILAAWELAKDGASER